MFLYKSGGCDERNSVKRKPEDIPEVVNHEMGQEQFSSLIKPGMEIAITAGSRGIRNVDIITKAIVDFVKAKGAHPFIVPAMGSHGGATAEGQLQHHSGDYGLSDQVFHGSRRAGRF